MSRLDELTGTLDKGLLSLFIDNPVEFLCAQLADSLLATSSYNTDANGDNVWAQIYGDSIDGYMRMDYDVRQLPALRIYNETGQKEHESWWITGDIKIDSIFPASVRRTETQQFQDTITGAIIQQFRSSDFFQAVEKKVPGLNELGKIVSWDKTLGFDFEEGVVPLTQITLNFRLDQRIWDDYLESEGRTKQQPFAVTLGNLQKIASTIQALKDDNTDGPSIGATVLVKGG